MLILGIDPGIANLGWALVDVLPDRRYKVCAAGTFCAESRRRTEIRKIPARTTKTGKTFKARRVREAVPGSLSESENDTQRCGQIFQHVRTIMGGRMDKVRAVAIEDRTINAVWAASTKMNQQGVLVAVECAAVAKGVRRDLVPVKDVHAALAIKIPRGHDAKSYVDDAVRATVDCTVVDESILDKRGRPSSKRVHAIDAIGVVIAASLLEYTRTYRLLEEMG